MKIIMLETTHIPHVAQYEAGEIYDVPDETAALLIGRGHAKYQKDPQKKTETEARGDNRKK